MSCFCQSWGIYLGSHKYQDEERFYFSGVLRETHTQNNTNMMLFFSREAVESGIDIRNNNLILNTNDITNI